MYWIPKTTLVLEQLFVCLIIKQILISEPGEYLLSKKNENLKLYLSLKFRKKSIHYKNNRIEEKTVTEINTYIASGDSNSKFDILLRTYEP